MIQTLEWTNQGVRFIDQTKLPTEEVYVNCTTHQQVADVIRNMVVRGAPAIGVAAAMGIALGVQNSKAETGADLKKDFDGICEIIRQTRPTAVNLFWAIKQMQEKFETLRVRPVAQIKQALVEESQRMHAEDIAANQTMGRHGATLMPASGGVLTHCNAGRSPPPVTAHTAWCRSRAAVEAKQEDSRLRRRDTTIPARFASDRMGTDERRHPDHGHL
jgi:methylthioribose-1-phosphate isomerase